MKYLFSWLIFSLSTTYLAERVMAEVREPDASSACCHDLPGGLYLGVDNYLFFVNNEFFGDMVEGYTLPGFITSPKMVYLAGDIFEFEAGAKLVKFHGDTNPLSAYPLLSARINLPGNIELSIGTINSNYPVPLHDALFHRENEIFHPVQNGVELTYHKGRSWFNCWVDWQQYIRRGDTIPEIFTAGLNSIFSLSQEGKALSFTIPVQMVAWHTGGQVGERASPVQTLINFSAGFEAAREMGGKINNISLSGYLFLFLDPLENNPSGIYNGHGYYSGATALVGSNLIEFAWWGARDFIAPRGNPIYGSISTIPPNHEVFGERDMLICKYRWSKVVSPRLKFIFHADGYFDTRAGWFDYGLGVTLRFNPRLLIKSAPLKGI